MSPFAPQRATFAGKGFPILHCEPTHASPRRSSCSLLPPAAAGAFGVMSEQAVAQSKPPATS